MRLLWAYSILEFMELAERPQWGDLLARGLQYESIEDYAQASGTGEELLREAEETYVRLNTMGLISDLHSSRERLLDEVWLARAQRPRLYRTEMRELLRHIANLAKNIYGVRNHRMAIHDARDRELWRLKRIHPERTFGQLGLKFGLSAG